MNYAIGRLLDSNPKWRWVGNTKGRRSFPALSSRAWLRSRGQRPIKNVAGFAKFLNFLRNSHIRGFGDDRMTRACEISAPQLMAPTTEILSFSNRRKLRFNAWVHVNAKLHRLSDCYCTRPILIFRNFLHQHISVLITPDVSCGVNGILVALLSTFG